MSSIFFKIFVLWLIFLGEALSIYAEIIGARNFSLSQKSNWSIFVPMFLLIIIGGGCLLLGYVWGYKAFKNIWIVSIMSLTSILMIEPALDWMVFHQLPAKGQLIGFICGLLGFIATLVF